MQLTRLYYRAKPLLPGRIRLFLRRLYANRIFRKCNGSWPIEGSTPGLPAHWAGWPERKRFAFILTHDVESKKGLDRVEQLARLEMSLGMRSSFNFVPEGDYSVPRELREWLENNGFEVGVHDLKHDGRLFETRSEFRHRAQRINHYLEDWRAVGFRSGFMLRNLDWIQELEIQYDASTFDIDPFEPQPEGVGCIFPFWVRGVNGRPGFAELPYTLPQDSTIFLLLKQDDISTWLNKLDWIANSGGMAMVIVHPDYLRFDREQLTTSTYTADLYSDFLKEVKRRYSGQYWHALPREVAQFVKENELGVAPAISKAAAVEV